MLLLYLQSGKCGRNSGRNNVMNGAATFEELNLDRIYLEQLLLLVSIKECETIILWSLVYKPIEIAKVISYKFEKHLINPTPTVMSPLVWLC